MLNEVDLTLPVRDMDLSGFTTEPKIDEWGNVLERGLDEEDVRRMVYNHIRDAIYGLFARKVRMVKDPNTGEMKVFNKDDYDLEDLEKGSMSFRPEGRVDPEDMPNGRNWIRSTDDIIEFTAAKTITLKGGVVQAGDIAYVDVTNRKRYATREAAEAALPSYALGLGRKIINPASTTRPPVANPLAVSDLLQMNDFVIKGGKFKLDGKEEDWSHLDGKPVQRLIIQEGVPEGMIKVRFKDNPEQVFLAPMNMVIPKSHHINLPEVHNQSEIDGLLTHILNDNYDAKAMVYDLMNGDYADNGYHLTPESIIRIQEVADEVNDFIADNPENGIRMFEEGTS